MPTSQSKKALYRDSRNHTGLNKRQWGRLFGLGSLKNTAQVVTHKESEDKPCSKGVNMPEALASQLLSFMHDQGFDIARIEFDDTGKITNVPTVLAYSSKGPRSQYTVNISPTINSHTKS